MRYIFVFFSVLLFIGCKQNDSELKLYKINGETMGTYYIVSYYAQSERIDKIKIDLRLQEINQELSTYIPTSTISIFNKDTLSIINPKSKKGENQNPLFDFMFQQSKIIFQNTNGYFDPTVMPLVNYWGFGYKQRNKSLLVDSQYINNILSYVGFHKINRTDYDGYIEYKKTNKKTQLDFSAIAKGYAVDLIGSMLAKQGIKNYLVDIGGELIAYGNKPNNKNWIVGIAKPDENADLIDIVKTVQLKNKAMASSGNYRNFYKANGQKYSHTINPKTGFTERNELLSVSIIANNCTEADAYATACMVMGITKAKKLINKKDKLEACFILNKDGHLVYEYSDGFLAITQK